MTTRFTFDNDLPLRLQLKLKRRELDAKLDLEDQLLCQRLRLIEAYQRLNRRLSEKLPCEA